MKRLKKHGKRGGGYEIEILSSGVIGNTYGFGP